MGDRGISILGRLIIGGFRAFFYLLYNQFSWTYDWVAALVSLGRWNDWVNTTLRYLPQSSILELGHGPGHLQVLLSQRGNKSVGIDASSYMGRIAKKNLNRSVQSFRLVQSRAQDLPFSGDSFTCIVATFPSEYIADLKTIREISRVLEPGGRLVVLPFAWITGRKWYDRFAAWVFRITRQAPSQKQIRNRINELYQLDVMRDLGFQIEIQTIESRSSRLMFILADKPAG